MKKIISALLCVLMLFCCFAVTSSAVSEKQGMDALRAQFQKGQSELDYVYYSPAGKNDDTKYPLVVWLHGNSSGDYPGHQLDNCNIALWSSEEYQNRFADTKGAYLLLPRFPTSFINVAWEGTTTPLKKTIDAFVRRNIDNIDTDRIYIGGYSLGGKMTLKMAMAYPSYFAAAFPLSPVFSPSNAELNNLIDMPLWFFWCKNDDYASLNPLTVLGNWNYLMNISNCRSRCRISTFDRIYNADYGLKTADGKPDIHNTWDAACHDMFMNDNKPQKDVVTKDGNGTVVTLSYPQGLIYWLSCQSKANENEETGKRSSILDVLSKFIDMIKRAFAEILKAITG